MATARRILAPLTDFRIALAVALVALLFLLPTDVGAQGDEPPIQPPPIPLDHFKCYTAKGQPVDDLAFLRDQFAVRDKTFERDVVTRPEFFCNTTRKLHGDGGAGISDLANHLAWYGIKPVSDEGFQPRDVVVRNQFGPEQKLTVRRPEYLAVPTQKLLVDDRPTDLPFPERLDHFKCYSVKGEFQPVPVSLQDQFDRMAGGPNAFPDARVMDPRYLCNPTDKAHFLGFDDAGNPQLNTVRVQNPQAHLVCYEIKAEDVRRHDLLARNQFGPQQKLRTDQPKLLCVPSHKREVPPPPPPIEIDHFPNSVASLLLVAPDGQQEEVNLSGPSRMHVLFEGPNEGDANDDDGNGKDEVQTEIVALQLSGDSSQGPIMVRLHPNRASAGRMEEQTNKTPGTLDVPPFVSPGPGETFSVDSFFDVSYEIEMEDGGLTLHAADPLRIGAVITHKPPAPGETYVGEGAVDLLDANGNPTGMRLLRITYTPVPPPPLAKLDHFKCYDASGEEIGDLVGLRDQFGAQRDIVARLEFFCNTTRKIHDGGGAGISDVANHLAWYGIKPVSDEKFRPRNVMVRNQFGPEQKLTVRRPEYLAVPTQKLLVDDRPTNLPFPEKLDHFKCYSVKGEFQPVPVSLQDQFDPNLADAQVLDPRYLCNPTGKVHFDAAGNEVGTTPIQHPEAHLVCYAIETEGVQPHSLLTRNQFGPEQQTGTDQPKLLCVPSLKRQVPPPPPPPPVLDHFKCYDVKGEEIGDLVGLRDQFGAQRDIVGRLEIFCNTTRKLHGDGGAGISDVANHLAWYGIRPVPDEKFQPRDVVVRNQFARDGMKLTVRRPEYLAVPTQKLLVDDRPTNLPFPEKLDHFKCYSVKGEFQPVPVRLQDQFDRLAGGPNSFSDARVLDPRYLCNPTGKVHFDEAGEQIGAAQVQNPQAHLVCYEIKAEDVKRHDLLARNQFGPEQKLRTDQPELLCVPSKKREVPPPPPSVPPVLVAGIKDLVTHIEGLPDDTLNNGQRNSLVKKLEQTLERAEDGQACAAVNTLNAYLNEVQALRNRGEAQERGRGRGRNPNQVPPIGIAPVAEDLYNQGRFIVDSFFDVFVDVTDPCFDPSRGQEPQVEVVASDNTQFAAQVSFGAPSMWTVQAGGETWTQLELPAVQPVVGENGQPAIPAWYALVAVPSGADARLSTLSILI